MGQLECVLGNTTAFRLVRGRVLLHGLVHRRHFRPSCWSGAGFDIHSRTGAGKLTSPLFRYESTSDSVSSCRRLCVRSSAMRVALVSLRASHTAEILQPIPAATTLAALMMVVAQGSPFEYPLFRQRTVAALSFVKINEKSYQEP